LPAARSLRLFSVLLNCEPREIPKDSPDGAFLCTVSFFSCISHLIESRGLVEMEEEGARKIPFYFRVNDEPVFAFAGLSEEWQDSQGNKFLRQIRGTLL
jgi:hypothetical protein